MNTDAPDMRHARLSPRRWLARVSLAGDAAAVLVFATVSGVKGLLLLLVFAAAVAVIMLGVWLFVAYRGALRTTGLVVIVVVAASVTVVEIAEGLLWLVVVCVGLLAGGYVVGSTLVVPNAYARRPRRSAGVRCSAAGASVLHHESAVRRRDGPAVAPAGES